MQVWQLARLPTTLPFKDVRVTASYQHISREQLRDAIKNQMHDGFFALDVEKFKQNLQQQLPWVASVVVRRVWPGVLKVTVVEQRAVVSWNDNQLVNDKGRLFSPEVSTFPSNMPKLFGPPGSFATVLAEYQFVEAQLARLHLHVKRLVLTGRQAWHLLLSNDVMVMMGKENSSQRLMQFIRMYPNLMAEHAGNIQVVDLRYPNGFAVK